MVHDRIEYDKKTTQGAEELHWRISDLVAV